MNYFRVPSEDQTNIATSHIDGARVSYNFSDSSSAAESPMAEDWDDPMTRDLSALSPSPPTYHRGALERLRALLALPSTSLDPAAASSGDPRGQVSPRQSPPPSAKLGHQRRG